MAEGVGFPFPSLPLNEGRTYGQPEVVLISLPQGALLRRGRSDSSTPTKAEEDAVGNQCWIRQKGESVSWLYFTLQ